MWRELHLIKNEDVKMRAWCYNTSNHYYDIELHPAGNSIVPTPLKWIVLRVYQICSSATPAKSFHMHVSVGTISKAVLWFWSCLIALKLISLIYKSISVFAFWLHNGALEMVLIPRLLLVVWWFAWRKKGRSMPWKGCLSRLWYKEGNGGGREGAGGRISWGRAIGFIAGT